MTGEEMRLLMWGHRSSICTPTAVTPRQQSLDVDAIASMARKDAIIDMSGLNDLSGGGLSEARPGNVFDCLDESLSAAAASQGQGRQESDTINIPSQDSSSNGGPSTMSKSKRTRR